MMSTLNKIKLVITVVSCVALSACNTLPRSSSVNKALLNSDTFTLQPVPTPQDIFQLDDRIKNQLDNYFRGTTPSLSHTKKLLRFLVDNGDASLSYQSGANLTASQAYFDLNANCLSLSILSFSLAEHLGFKSQFQRVHIPEYWDQTQGYNLLTGHVNLVISESNYTTNKNKSNGIALYTRPQSLTIDFDPNSRQQKFTTSDITKQRILAMFYSNRGAMHMINAEYDLAFSYFKAAISADELYSGAWGNLGVLYRVANQYQRAEDTYQQALALNADNKTVLGNMALLYRMTNRDSLAIALENTLNQQRKNNPYYQIVLGNEALENNDFTLALRHFNKARKLDSKLHKSYFGLAKVHYYRGNLEQAEKYLLQAYKLSEYKHDRKRYQSKLQWIQAVAKN
ncbi:tetratricopeptide repeat protein [Pseudoalteromonas aurantia]|nr:tetratricopeptide repeat protein [Pseudoalteromonas aurantia]